MRELEGLSIALLEAISYGNYLLVSDIPENLEALQGVGYRFQTGNRRDLAKQLQWLLDHPAQVEAARAQAQAYADRFYSWEKVSWATLQLYEAMGQIRRPMFGPMPRPLLTTIQATLADTFQPKPAKTTSQNRPG